MKAYDYIFLGTGAAGLSLLIRMLDSGKFTDKRILIVDRDKKQSNDRTWCFWEKGAGYFETVVKKTWDHLSFKSDKFSSRLDTAEYRYKMIRAIDFYQYCFSKIEKQSNIEIINGNVLAEYQDGQASYYVNQNKIPVEGSIVFNSIFFKPKLIENGPALLQHFQGWMIETSGPVFDPTEAVLMDFRVHQNHGTSFVYVLPLSSTRALVEYTLFTKQPLAPEVYNNELNDYISQHFNIRNFRIVESEYGEIPMAVSNSPFFENGVYNIGMVGGQTKASTGYTFSFIQKQSEIIVQALMKGQILTDVNATRKRFKFYDSVLLRLLLKGEPEGKEIFTRLFERNKAATIFKFLDNESSIAEDISIIRTLQTAPFLKAALQHLF